MHYVLLSLQSASEFILRSATIDKGNEFVQQGVPEVECDGVREIQWADVDWYGRSTNVRKWGTMGETKNDRIWSWNCAIEGVYGESRNSL